MKPFLLPGLPKPVSQITAFGLVALAPALAGTSLALRATRKKEKKT